MSCFNCYSSRRLEGDIIDKVLERGQKLRNCIVQSILNNEPLNADFHKLEEKYSKFGELPQEASAHIKAFLQGDAMSRRDEIQALETLKSLSAIDLCKVTDRTYGGEEPCNCYTCLDYRQKDLNCDMKRVNNEIVRSLKERTNSETSSYFNYVDSLKISINSVELNRAGDKKVLDNLAKQKTVMVGQTFYLEYHIPDALTKECHRNKSKVDSGLQSGNVVRLCARRSQQQVISFKQTSIHGIQNLSNLSWEDIVIQFQLSFRNPKQKTPVQLGVAKFNFSVFQSTKTFVSNQEVVIKLNEKIPLVVGGLKLSVQLGCGHLYFGKEFIDAITNNKENAITLDSDEISNNRREVPDFRMQVYPEILTPMPLPGVDQQISQRMGAIIDKKEPMSQRSEPTLKNSKSICRQVPVLRNCESAPSKYKPVVRKFRPASQKVNSVHHKPTAKCVLFGFIYVSQAEFSREVLNSYVTCQTFGQEDIISSRLTPFCSNPIYDMCQEIPLVYDDDLLLSLRENFMVLEFFEKTDSKDLLLGLCKLSLHQFYLAYRNPTIVKYLFERKVPVIGVDGWEDIININDGKEIGRVQIVLALGSREQIDNLEIERGFRNQIVKAKAVAARSKTVDVAVQSDMEQKCSKEVSNEAVAQLTQVETATNTDPEIHSTDVLLESLHKALSLDSPKPKNSFKANVAVIAALHLPSRRKCKSKRSRGRSGKHEDILPSAYVTFECCKNDVKVTPIIPKTTTPQWDFRCNVNLPVEYITNSQKCLVFKVWRKSTNTTMTPNMQADHIIGFATLDLTVLLAGLPNIQGWFHIKDLSNKCHGQINIHITPLECLAKYEEQREIECCYVEPEVQIPNGDNADEPGELFGRALKRKFTELDEITQRLRLRLSKVTNDESDTSNDEIADEFERDINTLCVEDDFDMVDLEKEAGNFDINHVKDVGLLQAKQYLTESKQKIDVLLEKLSLISGENSSRYVSGCSDGRLDTEAILSELDKTSRPNLHSSNSFHRDMMQKFGSPTTSEACSGSSECRGGPEGEGDLSDN